MYKVGCGLLSIHGSRLMLHVLDLVAEHLDRNRAVYYLWVLRTTLRWLLRVLVVMVAWAGKKHDLLYN